MLLIGIFGLGAITFLFPWIAAFLINPATSFRSSKLPRSVSVLIPAHNEERVIRQTVGSCLRAMAALESLPGVPKIEVELLVGADACNDATAAFAENAGARVIVINHQSKWLTLHSLLALARGEWIVFADAGILWPEDLLKRVLHAGADETNLAVMPAYRQNPDPTAHGLEDYYWALESQIKRLENDAGGPLSAHGATVAYRAEALKRALGVLGTQPWLNDDLVIPLMIRYQNECHKTLYLQDVLVTDQLGRGHVKQKALKLSFTEEWARRRRMALGNVQWISSLLPRIIKEALRSSEPLRRKHAALILLLAMRRVFRVLWAYWLLALASACCNALFLPYSLQLVIFLGVAFVLSRQPAAVRPLAAALASLSLPFEVLLNRHRRGVLWR